jgi:hypothetical protein
MLVHKDELYHPGLPHTRFMEGMKVEHCTKAGHDALITTSNYGITTTPQREWKCTVLGEAFAPEDLGHGRVVKSIDEHMKNVLVATAKLSREEVVAMVLYTGPMVGFVSSLT